MSRYLFRYYDEAEYLINKKVFNNKPTKAELEALIVDVDVVYQAPSVREVLKADGDFIEFVSEDDQGNQDALYYAQLTKMEGK